jgi:hypothetical protein
MQKNPIKLSCGDCGHASVCKIAPNVESMLASLFPKEGKLKAVCQPEDFANICGAFIPKSQLAEAEHLKEAAASELAAEAPPT